MQVINEYLTHAFRYQKDDLFSLSKNHPRWIATHSFATNVNCGNEKFISKAIEGDNGVLYTILAAYTKQTKSAINFHKLEPKILHHIMNMSLEDCDKLRPLLSKGKDPKNLTDVKAKVDYKAYAGLGAKFWKSLMALMLKNTEDIEDDCELFNAYPNTEVTAAFWN